VGVGAGGEVGEARGAGGDAGEHGVAVGDGLVARESDGALQGAGGADDLSGGCGGRHWFQFKWFCDWLRGVMCKIWEAMGFCCFALTQLKEER
jgi:hypothetical protein